MKQLRRIVMFKVGHQMQCIITGRQAVVKINNWFIERLGLKKAAACPRASIWQTLAHFAKLLFFFNLRSIKEKT